MAKFKTIFKLLFGPRILPYIRQTPKRELIRHLVTIMKYPFLYYKTVGVTGFITVEEGITLYEAVLKIKHKSSNIIEIGAYKGLSTIYLAEAAKRVNKKVKSFEWFLGLPAVDPILDSYFSTRDLVSNADEWESNVRKYSSRDTVELIVGDARVTMLPALNNGGFALAFLDVDLYETTYDLLLQLRRVATGGEVILIHNATSAGIKKAIGEFLTLYSHPVKEEYILDNIMAKLTIPLWQ